MNSINTSGLATRVQNPLHLRWSACFIAPLFVTGDKATVHNECITKELSFFFHRRWRGLIRVALNVLLFGRKITPTPVSLISFRLRNFQLILGFEKRTGKRAILKKKEERDGRKNPQRYETFQRINLEGGGEILRSNGTKILRETYENCASCNDATSTTVQSQRCNAITLPFQAKSRVSLALHGILQNLLYDSLAYIDYYTRNTRNWTIIENRISLRWNFFIPRLDCGGPVSRRHARTRLLAYSRNV